MRISDWSSDVCSSDLRTRLQPWRRRSGGTFAHDRGTRHPGPGKCKVHLPQGRLDQECRVHPTAADPTRTDHAGSAVVRPRSHRRQGTRSTRSEEHTSELQSLMRISYAVFCWRKKTWITQTLN